MKYEYDFTPPEYLAERYERWPDTVVPGLWEQEPHVVKWEFAGLQCFARRGPVGSWCGYVSLPSTHPWHGISNTGCTRSPSCVEDWCGHSPEINVHGGLTFGSEADRVGAPGTWVFGFDCVHPDDLTPWMGRDNALPSWMDGATYRTLGYVMDEVEGMAHQLASVVWAQEIDAQFRWVFSRLLHTAVGIAGVVGTLTLLPGLI